MVELPRNDAFRNASQADAAPAGEVAKSPAAEAPKGPAVEASVPAAPAPRAGRKLLKRSLLIAALVAVVGVGGDFGYRYWTVGRFIE
ncbi:HlyD family secretion protein, partial [Rhizobium sp. A37_96]